MRKTIIALLAIGAVLGLGFAARRMRAHASEMAAHCKEMMSNRNGGGVPPSGREVDESGKTEGAAAPTV